MHITADTVPGRPWADGRLDPARVKDLLGPERVPAREFRFGLTELPPGGRTELHRHAHARIELVVSGRAGIRIAGEGVTLVINWTPVEEIYIAPRPWRPPMRGGRRRWTHGRRCSSRSGSGRRSSSPS
ncbi:MAG: hypothetical protein L0027_10755 [Candidatus Rokubacteria bacterium]|nr:hypothetical protein [Candidatus Rokubacteria bacterium]